LKYWEKLLFTKKTKSLIIKLIILDKNYNMKEEEEKYVKENY